MRFPRLAHRSAAAHKLHSTPQQDRMNLISGKGETSSRLPAFSLFLPGSCPNYRDRRTTLRESGVCPKPEILDAGGYMADGLSFNSVIGGHCHAAICINPGGA